MIDPRQTKAGLTNADLDKQAELQTNIITLMEKAKKLEDSVETKLKDLKKEEQKDEDAISKLEETLALLQTAEGIYMKPMLIAQISYLYNMLNRADQVPGKDAYDRYNELTSEFEKINK